MRSGAGCAAAIGGNRGGAVAQLARNKTNADAASRVRRHERLNPGTASDGAEDMGYTHQFEHQQDQEHHAQHDQHASTRRQFVQAV